MLVQNRSRKPNRSLPPDVNAYGITVRKSVSSPLLIFTIYSPKGDLRRTVPRQLCEHQHHDELLRVPGVGQTTIFGASDYAMRIWLQPGPDSDTRAHGGRPRNAVAKQNTVNPAGRWGRAGPQRPRVHRTDPRPRAALDRRGIRERGDARKPRRIDRCA